MSCKTTCLYNLTMFRNTIETWSIEIGGDRSFNTPSGQSSSSINQMQTTSEQELCSSWLSDGNASVEVCQTVPDFGGDMLDHLDSQFWLKPSGMVWSQWDSLLGSIPNATFVE